MSYYAELNEIKKVLGLRKDDFARKLGIFGIEFLRAMAEEKTKQAKKKCCKPQSIMSPVRPISAYGLCYQPNMYCMAYFMPAEEVKEPEPNNGPDGDEWTVGDVKDGVDVYKILNNLKS